MKFYNFLHNENLEPYSTYFVKVCQDLFPAAGDTDDGYTAPEQVASSSAVEDRSTEQVSSAEYTS